MKVFFCHKRSSKWNDKALILVSENGTETIGLSTIKGTGTKYSDFTWQTGTTRALMAQLTMDNLFGLLKFRLQHLRM
jgi:hypothetical protein